jgi:hypothetical protein
LTARLSTRVAAATPPPPSCRFRRSRHKDAAFAPLEKARPVELNLYEATSTFTPVTTRIVAHPALRGFVDGLQKATFPSPPAIQATGLPTVTLAGLPPASACGPSLGTLKSRFDPFPTRDPVPIAASGQRPTPQPEDHLPENREHRAVVTEAWFAATPP